MLNPIVRSADTSRQELDFDLPVVNIGSHPENDIVLGGPSILPFHASVQSQDGHFSFFALGETSEIKIDGLHPGVSPVTFSAGEPVEIGGYLLTFQKKGDSGGMHVSISANLEGNLAPAGSRQESFYTVLTGENPILVNVLSQQADVQVGQAAVYELEIINAGLIVAEFSLSIEGIAAEWVKIEPERLNLFEGQHGTAHITVAPPRSPDSKAGLHPFEVVTASANYAGRLVKTPLTLNIAPYYEFTVGTLSPRQARIHWRKHHGTVKLPITNASNSDADVNVSAFDDENGCSFDFQVSPDLERSRQATVTVPAGQSTTLPIKITPLKQPLAALRNKSYHYTTTAQIAQAPTVSQAVSGTATSIPLFGWWTIVLTALLVIGGLFLLLQPRIYRFDVASGKDVIIQGDSTTLNWSVSPFATSLSLSNVEQAITRSQVSLTIVPTQSTTYNLVASNWLAGLFGLNQKRTQTILVVPPKPVINVFEVDRTSVPEGTPSNVRWSVTTADKVLLTIDKVVYELKPDQFSGEQQVTLTKDSLVTLEAANASGSELRSFFVKVVPPRITVNAFVVWVRPASSASVIYPDTTRPRLSREGRSEDRLAEVTPPDPNFPEKYVGLVPDSASENGYRVQFFQPKRELSKGEQVMIQWDIDGAENDHLQIAPFTDTLPSRGAQPFFPQESMNFVLTAKSGKLEKIFMLPVKVFDGVPPAAPKIEFFQVTPASLVGPGSIQFAWSVAGEWTKIQLITENTVIADNLNPQGFKTVSVTKSGTYILTACNGTLCTSSPKDVTVNPALIDPGLIVSSISPTTGRFQIGAKLIVTIQFTKLPAGGTYPTGTVTVTDGGATCSVTLPAVTCNLQFTTSGTKTITASFPGDKIYQQSISPAFPQQVVVASAEVDLIPSFYFIGSTTLVSVETTSFNMDKGIETIVEVRPKNTILADNNGNISVSLCDQDANEAVIMSTCVFVGSAQVKVASTTTTTQTQGYGYADIVITNFNASGTHGLLFEYTHSQNAIDPTSKFQPNIHINRTRIALSLSTCTDPNNFVGCTYGLASNAVQEIIFDLNTPGPNGAVPLTSLLPAPQISAFKISSSPSLTWACSIKVMSGTYKYDCKVTGLVSGTTYTVTFDYDYKNPITGSTIRNDYYMGPDSTIPFGGYSFQLQVLSITKTIIGNLTGVRVGDRIKLTGPSTAPGIISIFDGSNTLLSPIPSTGVTLTEKSGADLFGIAENEGVNCSVDSTGSTVTVQKADANCYIYFKHVGSYTISATFAGDNYYNSSTSGDMQVVVSKQSQITGKLQYFNTGAYIDGTPTNLVTSTGTSFRIVFTGPDSSFSPDTKTFPPVALAERKVLLTLSGWATEKDANGDPNCWVDTSNLVVDKGSGVYEITITQQPIGDLNDLSTVTYVTVADLTSTCSSANSLGLSFSVIFSDQTTPKDSDDFAFTSPLLLSNLRVNDPSLGTMSVSMVREDTAKTVMLHPDAVDKTKGTVDQLHYGQKYDLSLTGDPFSVSYNFTVDWTYVYRCFWGICVGVTPTVSSNTTQATASLQTRSAILTNYTNSGKWTVDPTNFVSQDPDLGFAGSNCGANMPLTAQQSGAPTENFYWTTVSSDHYWDGWYMVRTYVNRQNYFGAMGVQLYTTEAQKCMLQFDGVTNSGISDPTHSIGVSAISGDGLFAPNNLYTVGGIDKQDVSMTIDPTSSSGAPLTAAIGSNISVTLSLVSTDISGGTSLPFVGTTFLNFFSPGLDPACPLLTSQGSIANTIVETYTSTVKYDPCVNTLSYLGNKYFKTTSGQTFLKFTQLGSTVNFTSPPPFISGGAFASVNNTNLSITVSGNPPVSSPVPSGSVVLQILNSGGSAYDCSTQYTLTGGTCDAAAKSVTIPITNGVTALFSIQFNNSIVSTNNTISLAYNGDSNFTGSSKATGAFEIKQHASSVAFTSTPSFISSGTLNKGQAYPSLSVTVADADNPARSGLTPTGNVTLEIFKSNDTAYTCGGATPDYTLTLGTCDAATNTIYTIPLPAGSTSAFSLTFNVTAASTGNYIMLKYAGDSNFKAASTNKSTYVFAIQ